MNDRNGDVVSLMTEAFTEARQTNPDSFHKLTFTVAGHPLEIRVVGNALATDIKSALAHLSPPAPDHKPDLVFELWDQAETGVGCSVLDSTASQKEFCLVEMSPDGRFMTERRDHSFLCLDRATSRAVGITGSIHTQHIDERARPLQRPLSVWLEDKNIQFVHAALVAIGGTGILFGGAGGAGKSSTSIASLLHGHDFLGDDFIGMEKTADGSFVGHSLFASCLVDSGRMAHFPQLARHAMAPNHDFESKSVVYLAHSHSSQLIARTTIDLLLLPRVVDQDKSSWRQASMTEAMLALAPTSVLFTPTPSGKAFELLSDLIDAVPTYRLELGRDIQDIPLAVEKIVAEAVLSVSD